MNLEWPNRLFLDRTAYKRAVLPAGNPTEDETGQEVLELTAELEADVRNRYPEFDEDNQRQATS